MLRTCSVFSVLCTRAALISPVQLQLYLSFIRHRAECNKSHCRMHHWLSSITRTRPMRWRKRSRLYGRSPTLAGDKALAEDYGWCSVPVVIATQAILRGKA